MNIVMAIHIAAGMNALLAGTVAAAARKGGHLHARAGTFFFASMLVLGITAAALEPFRSPEPGSPVGGIIVCYFVLTSWMAARRSDGITGRFEIGACAAALTMAALIVWGAITGASTPAGSGPVFVFAGICLVAGLLDLNAVLRRKLTPAQRVARHLWRVCFAFFVATGSFFLGQQDLMPAAARGSPILFALAFAPLVLMVFWLIRVRFGKRFRGPAAPRRAAADPVPVAT